MSAVTDDPMKSSERATAKAGGWGSGLGIRLATAFLGLPLLVWILLGSSLKLAVVLGLLCALAGFEMVGLVEAALRAGGQLAPRDTALRPQRFIVAASCVALFAALSAELSAALLALLWIFLAALQAGLVLPRVRPLAPAVMACAAGVAATAYIAFPLALLSRLHAELGPAWVALAVIVTWFGDAGSYTSGRLFGRHRLAPRVSPGKTLEGCVGGVLTAIALALVLRALLMPDLGLLPCIAIAGSANAIGQAGDLLESCLKRVAQVKDSGQLFPGYGGVLDKIDSLLLAAPWIYACSLLLHAS